jgi:hypothetical protein
MSKIENKAVLNDELTQEQIAEVKVELMRYRKNSLSYTFGLCALISSIVAAFIGLNSLAYNFTTLIKILLNIAILLFGFLFTEQAKAYNKKGSLYLVILGAICFLRILWAPRILLFGTKDQWGRVVNDSININWLPSSASFRGYLSLGLLIAAGTCFVLAGIIGYIKSKKLEKHMVNKGVK